MALYKSVLLLLLLLLLAPSLAARQLELRRRFCTHLSSPVQPTTSPYLPGHRHPVNETAQRREQWTLDSYTYRHEYSRCLWLYHSHSRLESREVAETTSARVMATHCQQMEPLSALCLFPGLSHSSLSLLCNAGCRSANRL